jgi:PD-(D/E)XK nuclease superfamily
MTSLYGKLFKYRARERRSPLEDYLTECLADLFNRLEADTQRRFVQRLFVPHDLRSKWENFSTTIARLRMESQHPISAGRIDLVLFGDDHPLIAIENKISAPIGASDDDDDDQLVTYGKWIRTSARSVFPPIVCLLTHTTAPPEGFSECGPKSGRATPHIARWGAIGAALADISESSEGASSSIRMFASELLSFLEEKDMSHEFAGRDEFAAAIVYLRAGVRMEHTFDSIYNHIKTLKGSFAVNSLASEYSLYFATKENLIWGWAYLTHPALNGLFFGYGIALDPGMTFKEAVVPKYDSVFLCVGAEDKKSIQSLRAKKDVPKKPWMYADVNDWSTIIAFRPLHTFMADPERFAPQMIEWINDVEEDVRYFVSHLA